MPGRADCSRGSGEEAGPRRVLAWGRGWGGESILSEREEAHPLTSQARVGGSTLPPGTQQRPNIQDSWLRLLCSSEL